MVPLQVPDTEALKRPAQPSRLMYLCCWRLIMLQSKYKNRTNTLAKTASTVVPKRVLLSLLPAGTASHSQQPPPVCSAVITPSRC
jgi:hypothetical protein